MNKQEFLDELERELHPLGNILIVKQNIDFYSRYIDDKIREGRAEFDVLEELGSPRLIAHSIREANSGSLTNENEEGEYRDIRAYNLPVFRFKILLIIIVILLLALIIGLFVLLKGIFSLLAPFIVPLVFVVVIYSLLKGNRS